MFYKPRRRYPWWHHNDIRRVFSLPEQLKTWYNCFHLLTRSLSLMSKLSCICTTLVCPFNSWNCITKPNTIVQTFTDFHKDSSLVFFQVSINSQGKPTNSHRTRYAEQNQITLWDNNGLHINIMFMNVSACIPVDYEEALKVNWLEVQLLLMFMHLWETNRFCTVEKNSSRTDMKQFAWSFE